MLNLVKYWSIITTSGLFRLIQSNLRKSVYTSIIFLWSSRLFLWFKSCWYHIFYLIYGAQSKLKDCFFVISNQSKTVNFWHYTFLELSLELFNALILIYCTVMCYAWFAKYCEKMAIFAIFIQYHSWFYYK